MARSAVLLFGDVCCAIVVVDALGVFWRVTRTASRTLRNRPARMVRSAVLLFGDVCRAFVVVDASGVFWRVTRTASRTLRRPPRAHGTFRSPFVWRRLLSVCCGRCVGGFLADRLRGTTEYTEGTARAFIQVLRVAGKRDQVPFYLQLVS
jgi:hypothetical protein